MKSLHKVASRRVLIAIPTNGTDGQSRMEGIIRYANENSSWRMDFLTDHLDILEFLRRSPDLSVYDGIIAACNIADFGAADLRKSLESTPLVIANESLLPQFPPSVCHRAVLVNNSAIGLASARYFCSLGNFASYAFYHGVDESEWSNERLGAFRSQLSDTHDVVDIVGVPEKLAQELVTLPRPIALFAANDCFARKAIHASQVRGLRVPGDIAVLGCDNDRVLCEGIHPRISTIEPDFRQVGYRAAQILGNLMRHRTKNLPPIQYVSKVATVERESTQPILPATVLVERAVCYIRANAYRNIGVTDIAKAVGVSRSLLDRRFHKLRGITVHQQIQDLRFARFTELLRVSTAPLKRLATECGFSNQDNLMRQFKKRYGCTMSAWRAGLQTTSHRDWETHQSEFSEGQR